MAEAAGLALGVLGVVALFSTCVEAFDVVVSARECSQEYEELSALLGLQRLRFEIWGESVGLPSGRFKNEHKIPYNTQLDLPQVRPDIQRALENIRRLLGSVTAIDGRYGATLVSEEEATTLRGTHIFQKSFDRLKKRVRKGQKEKSMVRVARWAIHDAPQFKETIARLTTFVDGLYQVTTSLGLLQQRYEDLRIHEEVNAITDEGDLELLAEATSNHSPSSINRTVSDAASKRLSIVVGSVRDYDTDPEMRSRPHSSASTYSFHTALTKPSQHGLEAVEEEDSEDEDEEDSPRLSSTILDSTFASSFSARSCAECDEVSMTCSVSEDSNSCIKCIESQKECSFDLGGSSLLQPEAGTANKLSSPSSQSTPQHERLLAESAARSRAAPRTLSFKAGDANHGERMKEINDNNLHYWIEHGASLVYQAHRSTSVAKRMFHELKTIRKARVPFISATPVGDDLGKILASIEGPPETPYEGGIFWILVSASKKAPPGAPIIRFHTKIYHPNIDHRTGVLCADYEQKWSPTKVPAALKGHFEESTALWSERTSPDMWSLLALLIAICGLLASPNASDPLVPEIAQKYVEDPEGYYEAAKMWTAKYAGVSKKPDEGTLRFPDEVSEPAVAKVASDTPVEAEAKVQHSPSAVQQYLRSKYDEQISKDWKLLSISSQQSSIFTRNAGIGTLKRPGELVITNPRTGESEFHGPNIMGILDSLLWRDAKESHLRQMTGDCLSKIEQWRMVREVRFALEKELNRSSAKWSPASSLGMWTDYGIRSRIGKWARTLCGYGEASSETQYFEILTRSFHGTKRDEQLLENIHREDARRSRSAMSRPARPTLTSPTKLPKTPMPTPEATEADARKHRIPPGYSLKNWDPTEQPIMLLGSVFDANSLGKWIYDWTVYHDGPATLNAEIAGNLWLLLIQLAGKVKRAEEIMPRIRMEENREMVEDFIESGERLTDKLKKLLKTSETPILKASKKNATAKLGKKEAAAFVDSIFGRDGQLDKMEKLMASIRLWNLRFDNNCEDILRRPGIYVGQSSPRPREYETGERETGESLEITPISIRTAFGLEDIVEEGPKEAEAADYSMVRITEVEPNPNLILESDTSADHFQPGYKVEDAIAPNDCDKATPSTPSQPLDVERGSFSASQKGKERETELVVEQSPRIKEKRLDPEPAMDAFGWGSWGTSERRKKGKKEAKGTEREEQGRVRIVRY